MQYIQLQPLGGVAGDMFVACLLDAFPEHQAAIVAASSQASGATCRLMSHRDEVFAGSRFVVEDLPRQERGHQHDHVHWGALQRRLESCGLPGSVRDHAIAIFALLAEAEARVHGVAVEAVTFHEVGAIDSLADIVAAAAVIDAIGPAQWTIGPLPLGGGMVETAHGTMPVPAPATALLLQGFDLHDDGIAGERVTPTGAAILRHLDCSRKIGLTATLRASGTGFGTRKLQGRSNCLQALVLDDNGAATPAHRELAVVTFEVDDQSPEDLAMGLDRLRTEAGVHDVLQMACLSKKSRFAVHIQVLAAPEKLEQVIHSCFCETTTIGLRISLAQGRALPRELRRIDHQGLATSVKLVDRPGPGGRTIMTAKAEADRVQGVEGHEARQRLRREAERLALEQALGNGPA